jgi:hypothetical protein
MWWSPITSNNNIVTLNLFLKYLKLNMLLTYLKVRFIHADNLSFILLILLVFYLFSYCFLLVCIILYFLWFYNCALIKLRFWWIWMCSLARFELLANIYNFCTSVNSCKLLPLNMAFVGVLKHLSNTNCRIICCGLSCF